MFTTNRLGLPKELCRTLTSTNIIESPIINVRSRTSRVERWRDGTMVKCW